jgi:2-succinyl-5-enolpyruvyl-6-hydroxy-3-cyclohexene-1-carboxylate synthase
VASAPPSPDGALLDEIAERVSESPRGLIVAGRQLDPALAGPVPALAEKAAYPVLAEPTSQLRLGDHDRSLVVWPYDAIARLRPPELEPELVIRFGDMPTSKPLRQWLTSLPGVRQVVVDPAFGWNEPSSRAETIVRADARSLAEGLAERLGGDRREWRDAWIEAAGRAGDAIEGELAGLREPTEPGAHAALARLYADGELVYTASSMPIRDQEAFVPSGATRVRFLCNRGANGIDGLISSGIGAAAASGRPAWIVTGDLGLFHDMNGLAALREIGSPVRIVVLNNDGGGIFEFLPQATQIERHEFEALLGTPQGIDPGRVAALYDLPHVRVERLEQLAQAARQVKILIEIPVDRRLNVELHRRIAARVADALGVVRGAR